MVFYFTDKSIMKKLFFAFFVLILSACTLTTYQYYPSDYNNPRLSGTLYVGNFNYLPANLGQVPVDEIKGFGLGGFKLLPSVAEFVRNATKIELERSGVKTSRGKLQLTGQVKELSRNILYLNHSMVDFRYLVNYKITDTETGEVLLDRDYYTQRSGYHDDFVNNFGSNISKTIYASYEKFATDPDVKQILK